ncbi:unnamed protein product [Amoebophrya sp. A25]|nr:unnamed protein product [Amoebophrya sp. A25]|eukprot:GSA25T00021591001.1
MQRSSSSSSSAKRLSAAERKGAAERWIGLLKNGTQLDAWGQVLEAGEEYTELASDIGSMYSRLDSREKDILHRIVLCLSARVQAIQSPAIGTAQTQVTSQDLVQLETTIETLMTTAPLPAYATAASACGAPPDTFGNSPLNRGSFSASSSLNPANWFGGGGTGSLVSGAWSSASSRAPNPPQGPVLVDAEPAIMFPIPNFKWQHANPIVPQPAEICEGADAQTEIQTTHAALTSVKGTVVVLKVDKIGLKDAETYIDPFLTVLVADARGAVVDSHDTPLNIAEKRATHVHFGNHAVFLRMSFEDMQRNGCSIFFEFKHYKPKKKKISTRCWCFMELGELRKDEESVLELYHKPTDLKKKKINLHSVKPLYFHVRPSFMN